MKHYFLVIVVLLSLTVNTVVGTTVFQQPEHHVGVAESTHKSMASHHNDGIETVDSSHDGCEEDTGCHEAEVCCRTLYDAQYVIFIPQLKPLSTSLYSFENSYSSFKPKPYSTVPFSPD